MLSRSTDLAVRLLGGDPDRHGDPVTEDELRDMVAAQPGLTEQHRTIIAGAFEIAGRTLLEIVQPRGDVFVLPPEMPCDDGCSPDGLLALAGSNHTRAPVARDGNLDDFLGIVHLRDLVDSDVATVGESPSRPRPSPRRPRCSTPCAPCRPVATRWPSSSTSTVAPRASSRSRT